MKFCTLKYLEVLFESLFSLTELSEYGSISKLQGYVGTNTELLCAEFCNLVQCYIFVSHLSCYSFIKGVMNTRHTNTAAKRYSRLYRPIHLFYLEFITLAKESRL
jgi:hypothetical protein